MWYYMSISYTCICIGFTCCTYATFLLFLPSYVGLLSQSLSGTEVITSQCRLPTYYCLGHRKARKPTHHTLKYAWDLFQQVYSVGSLSSHMSALHNIYFLNSRIHHWTSRGPAPDTIAINEGNHLCIDRKSIEKSRPRHKIYFLNSKFHIVQSPIYMKLKTQYEFVFHNIV